MRPTGWVLIGIQVFGYSGTKLFGVEVFGDLYNVRYYDIRELRYSGTYGGAHVLCKALGARTRNKESECLRNIGILGP